MSSESVLKGSCQTLVAGTGMLGKHTEASQAGDLDLDELIKAQQAKHKNLRAQLDECDHTEESAPSFVPPFVEGAPVVAYSTGKYPPGTNDSDVESTGRKRKGKGLKRSFTSVSSPQKSPQGEFPSPMLQDSQDPNATPPRNETPESPLPPPTPVAGAPPAGSASVMPPPAAPAEAKDALYWRLRRHCVIKKSSASEEALKLWKTKDGRTKLRELMLKNNLDFGVVEMELKKSRVVSHGQKKEGKWVTKQYLQTTLSWTKKMADNAFDWAAKHNLIRTNEVHQEQEAKLILEDGFSYEQIDKEESHQTTRIEVEDPDGASLESEMPTNSRLEILRHPDGNVGQKPEDEVAANSGSFKLTFPTIQENSSAVSVLPHFMEVCGRKIDNTGTVLEKLSGINTAQAKEHAAQIQVHLNFMKDVYNKLETLQKECAVTRNARPEMQEQILRLCASCTKTDVALNNLVLRARTIKAPATKAKAKATKPETPAGKAHPKSKQAPKKRTK